MTEEEFYYIRNFYPCRNMQTKTCYNRTTILLYRKFVSLSETCIKKHVTTEEEFYYIRNFYPCSNIQKNVLQQKKNFTI